MYPFLPLQESNADDKLLEAIGRLGPIIVSAASTLPENLNAYWILAGSNPAPTVDQVVQWLDRGAEKVILPLIAASESVDTISKDRLVVLLDEDTASSVPQNVLNGVSGVFIKTLSLASELLLPIKKSFKTPNLYVQSTATVLPPSSIVRDLAKSSITLIIPTSRLTLDSSSDSHLNLADLFISSLQTDRADNLFPTVVSSPYQGGKSLGLVYSSDESIKESIITGKGVYQSRKHGLWRKGETSGATQTIVSIRADCDADALEFGVVQHGEGFCHLGTPSCFGDGKLSGLAALESTLLSRKESAPPGSYTRRLFEDEKLLAAKIREEAEELIQAQTTQEVAFEAADLIYFALTQCIAKGVSLADVEKALDAKAKKVTRRPGNAKAPFVQPVVSTSGNPTASTSAPPPPTLTPIVDSSAPITMRSSDLDTLDPSSRKLLLRRPVLKSDAMIARVKPIVDQVRTEGDAALLALTAKFDKATLTSPIILPPFSPESMQIPDDVKHAIDIAYQNIYTFHKAQAEKAPLIVETMPGVTCTRFARPIARVGLYVPGGTAILPSTALMLGIPAQVAGCKEIVLATPPRKDGSISPEVMYVARLVGASAVLKAGGAQAVAAMAYGTESVPKVDKIFGPGNQWVTAAKMLVQNDTDALVSIDMPAGPSEVLVSWYYEFKPLVCAKRSPRSSFSQVMTDSTGNPAYIAADLLSQAEHGVDSQVVLVAIDITDEHLAQITDEIDKQAHALPRVDIVRESIGKSIISTLR